MFLCVKNLTIVHRYYGGVLSFKKGQQVSSYMLTQLGVKIPSQYFSDVTTDSK